MTHSFNESSQAGLVEIRHPLSEAEHQLERSVLAATTKHFAGSAGSLRQAYDAMTAETPMADGVALEAIDQDGLRGWWIRPAGFAAGRAILFLHGGAYMLGSAQAYRGFASQVAARAGVAAFVLDYPLAPEHPFPAAFDAAVAARRWLRTQGVTQVALVGDSAGGALALATAHRSGSQTPAVAAIAVFSPWIDLALSGASFASAETRDPIFQPQILENAASTYLAGADPKDGRASPLYDVPDDLPPLIIQVGSDELLLDDARRYAKAAAEKGGEVRLEIFEGLHHVFQLAATELPSARRALDDAAGFLSARWA